MFFLSLLLLPSLATAWWVRPLPLLPSTHRLQSWSNSKKNGQLPEEHAGFMPDVVSINNDEEFNEYKGTSFDGDYDDDDDDDDDDDYNDEDNNNDFSSTVMSDFEAIKDRKQNDYNSIVNSLLGENDDGILRAGYESLSEFENEGDVIDMAVELTESEKRVQLLIKKKEADEQKVERQGSITEAEFD